MTGWLVQDCIAVTYWARMARQAWHGNAGMALQAWQCKHATQQWKCQQALTDPKGSILHQLNAPVTLLMTLHISGNVDRPQDYLRSASGGKGLSPCLRCFLALRTALTAPEAVFAKKPKAPYAPESSHKQGWTDSPLQAHRSTATSE